MSIRRLGSICLLPLALLFLLGILIFSMPEAAHSNTTQQSAMPHTHMTILTTSVPIDLPTLVIGGSLGETTLRVDRNEPLYTPITLHNMHASRLLNGLELVVTYDAAHLTPTDCTVDPDGAFGITECVLTIPRRIQINTLSPQGFVGDLDVAAITWDVLGADGEATDLIGEQLTLVDTSGVEISHVVQNQMIQITEEANQNLPTFTIGDPDGSPINAEPGQKFTTPIMLNNIENLNTMTLEVHYDESVLSPRSCNIDFDGGLSHGVCNMTYSSNIIRLAIVSSDGISGDVNIAEIEWEAISSIGPGLPIELYIIDISGPGVHFPNVPSINPLEESKVIIGNSDSLPMDVIPGHIFTTTVMIEDPIGLDLATTTIEVHYDNSLFRLVSCTPDPNSLFDLKQCDEEFQPDTVRFNVTSLFGVSGNVNIAEFQWEVIGTPGGSAIMELKIRSAGDPNGDSINYGTQDQVVNIIEGPKATIGKAGGSTLRIVIGDAFSVPAELDNIVVGDRFKTPIRLENMEDLGAAALSVYYDDSLVQPTGCVDTSSHFSEIMCDIDEAGTVRLSGTASEGLSSPAYLTELEWQVVGPVGESTALEIDVVTFEDSAGQLIPQPYFIQNQAVAIVREPTFYIDNLEGMPIDVEPGQIFTTLVRVHDPIGLNFAFTTVEIRYDDSRLRIINCRPDPDGEFNISQCNTEFDSDAIRFNVTSLFGVPGDVNIAELEWEVLDVPADSTSIELGIMVASNTNGTSIEYAVQNQVVNIIEEPEAITPTISIGNPDGSLLDVVMGQTFVTPVRVDNALSPGLATATVEVIYDPTVLKPVGCSEPTDTGRFDLYRCNPNFGLNTLRFNATTVSGLIGSSDMMDIRWEVIGATGSTSIDLAIVSQRDINDNPLNYATQNQMLNITEGTVVSIGEPEQSVTMVSRDIFQTSISIRNISDPDIFAYNFAVHYDPELVQPTSCEDHPETPFEANLCNLEYAPGVIRLNGLNPDSAENDIYLVEIEWESVGPPVDETLLDVEVLSLTDGEGASLDSATRDQVVKIIQLNPYLTIGNLDSSDLRVVEGQTFTTPLEIVDISPNNPMGGISLDVYYSDDLFQPTRCENHSDADIAKVLCNFEGEPGRIRLNGTSKVGVSGDARLAIIEWEVLRGDLRNLAYAYLSPDVMETVDIDGNQLDTRDRPQPVIITPLGDVNCDGQRGITDALFILQGDLELRIGSDQCEPEQRQERTLYLPACDVNGDEECNPVDALFILQCDIGEPNPLCPAGNPSTDPEVTAFESNALPDGVAAAKFYTEYPTIVPGSTFTSTVRVDSQAELGALTASLAYDKDQFRAVACQMVEDEAGSSGMCNLNASENRIRFNTAMPAGASGSRQLVDIAFEHVGGTVDMSAFSLNVSILANKQGERLPFTIDEGVKVYLPVIMR